MSSDTQEEIGATMLKIYVGCEQLADSVDDGNKKAAIKALIKCTMANMRLCRIGGGMGRAGIEVILNEDEDEAFKEQLLKLLTE